MISEVLGQIAPVSGLNPHPISRLVVDAHHASRRPEYPELANQSGIPFLVDPLTFLWQSPVREDHRWAKLPFGQASALSSQVLEDPFERERIAVLAVDFQRSNGATAIIPPYPYVDGPSDPWFEIALDLIDRTASYLSAAGVRLPMVPLLCFKVQAFATQQGLESGIDRFVEVANRHDVGFVAAMPSPAGGKDDGISKTRGVFRTLLRLNEARARVIAWRQGAMGQALVAAGMAGYETGLGTGEVMDVSSKRAQFKPRASKSNGGGGNDFVYIQLFNRSIRRRVAEVLFRDPLLGPKLMCDDGACCPTLTETLSTQRRGHAVRSRARQLRELDSQPHREWRLFQVASEAQQAAAAATHANRVLEANPPTTGKMTAHPKLGVKGFESIAAVARELSSLS
ncbi:hypothetical protein [Candidatus Poriferisodalis sp.]|uniref:hypothetical protein n=1 Tax=Candidatus Poriferisodalis sp. TaxID=3101277 RepID=UPI003B02B031